MGLLLSAAAPSDWVVRWSHLVPPGAPVLDVACGHGRHLRWFRARNHPVAGVDSAQDAIDLIAIPTAELVALDIESGPWPFAGRRFGGVVVTNYLHRPLLPVILANVAPGGALIYETFAAGQERVGRPSRPEFLLQPGELLTAAADLHVVGYEDGWLDDPPRRVQRIAAVRFSSNDCGASGNPALRADSIGSLSGGVADAALLPVGPPDHPTAKMLRFSDRQALPRP